MTIIRLGQVNINALFKKIIDLLKEKNAQDIVLFGGGIIMDDDIPKLKEMGVAEIFTPGTSTSKIAEFVNNIQPKT